MSETMTAQEAWDAMTPAERLCALYNAAHPRGLGILQFTPGEAIPSEFAGAEGYQDYVRGRVIKTNISARGLRPILFDRDNGPGAAEEAIIRAGRAKMEGR